MIRFTVPGHPHAQGRPRFARFKNFVRTYEDQESTDFKSRVAFFAKKSGVEILAEVSIALEIDIYLTRPKKYYSKKYPPSSILCWSRPDTDNFIKGISDALNGIAYSDDAQVSVIKARKMFHEIGGSPRVEISIYTCEIKAGLTL